MAPSSPDRISVDLQCLKAMLCERAHADGMLPSDVVRQALANALGQPAVSGVLRSPNGRLDQGAVRARLSLRMTRAQAATVIEAARGAGMNPGDYVADLVAGVPAFLSGARRVEHVAALIASCAEMSSLSRNVHNLTCCCAKAHPRLLRSTA